MLFILYNRSTGTAYSFKRITIKTVLMTKFFIQILQGTFVGQAAQGRNYSKNKQYRKKIIFHKSLSFLFFMSPTLLFQRDFNNINFPSLNKMSCLSSIHTIVCISKASDSPVISAILVSSISILHLFPRCWQTKRLTLSLAEFSYHFSPPFQLPLTMFHDLVLGKYQRMRNVLKG